MPPICPHHKGPGVKPMQESDKLKGGMRWFCPNKNPDGTWCDYRTKGSAAAPTPNGQGDSSDAALKAAALNFATRMANLPPEEIENALAIARAAYESMRGL